MTTALEPTTKTPSVEDLGPPSHVKDPPSLSGRSRRLTSVWVFALGAAFATLWWLTASHVLGPPRSAAPQEPSAAAMGEAESEEVLFRIGDRVFLAAEAQAQLDQMAPAVRDRFREPEARRAFFDKLLKQEALAREAERRGYADDPEVRFAMKKAMVLKLVKEHVDTAVSPEEVTEEAMANYYRAHEAEFVHPEEVHVTQVVVATESEARDVLEQAERLAASAPSGSALEQAAWKLAAFRNLVFERSNDPAAKRNGGEAVFVAGRDNGADPAVVRAALALAAPAELSPIVRGSSGFHVLMLRQRVPGLARSFEESKARIARLVVDDLRDRKVDAFVDTILLGEDVQVFEAHFDRVRFARETPIAAEAAAPNR